MYKTPINENYFNSSQSEVNKFVVPRELSRANSSEKKYIYIYIYIADVGTVAWQQCNKASMTSDKRIVGTRAVLLHVSL